MDTLRLLAEQDEVMELRKRDLREKVAAGLESLSRGAGLDGEKFFVRLEREESAPDSSPAG